MFISRRHRFSGWLLGFLLFVLVFELVLLAPKVLDTRVTRKEQRAADVTNNDSRDTGGSAQTNGAAQANGAAQTMVGINVVEIREEKKRWELWSDKAVSPKGEGDLDMDRVRARFYGVEGVEFFVTGDRGRVEAETKNMEVSGQVVMESSNGYVFRTENLSYNSHTQTLTTHSKVDVRGPSTGRNDSLTFTGRGLRAELTTEEMSLLNEVRGLKRVPERGGAMMDIQSGLAVFSSRDRAVTFKQDVRIKFESARVQGPSARFVYDATGKFLRFVELDGGIKVSDMTKLATSQSVRIDLIKNQLSLTGAPRVVQEADELLGDEIVFLEGGKKMQVKNARIKVSQEKLKGVN
jgi:LPS export ABC transporter protein LptC